MTITTDKRDIQAIISEYKNNDFDNLSTEQVLINGLKTTKLVYTGAYGGETHVTILIEDKINSKTFVVYYIDDVIFDQILSTFKFTK